MESYTVKEWKRKFYSDRRHIRSLDMSPLPDDIIICDVCNKEIRQAEDPDEKVVWVYNEGSSGEWALCSECKDDPDRLAASVRLAKETLKMAADLAKKSYVYVEDGPIEGDRRFGR